MKLHFQYEATTLFPPSQLVLANNGGHIKLQKLNKWGLLRLVFDHFPFVPPNAKVNMKYLK